MLSKKCLTIVSHKSVKQECLTRALRNSVKQGCPTKVSRQCVNSGCLTSEVVGNVTNKCCLCLSTYVSAFGFVGFILFLPPDLESWIQHDPTCSTFWKRSQQDTSIAPTPLQENAFVRLGLPCVYIYRITSSSVPVFHTLPWPGKVTEA